MKANKNGLKNCRVMISVIIPIYNCAEYVCDCLNSILSQKYDDIEVIIVDDGSSDESTRTAKDFSERYKVFKYIYIPHSGAGVARNVGIKHAKGDYIIFLDADDYYRDSELLKKLYQQISNYSPDVVMFQMIQVSEKGRLFERTRKPLLPTENGAHKLSEVYPILVRDGQVLSSACTKCVKRSLITDNDVMFMEGRTCEDIDWVLKLFSYSKTISFINSEAYAYRQHASKERASTTNGGASNLAFVIRKWADLLKNSDIPNKKAVAGIAAFEYGIYMGYSHEVSHDERKVMRKYSYLLRYGLDKKTRLIYKFYKVFGYAITCLAIRVYLIERRFRR